MQLLMMRRGDQILAGAAVLLLAVAVWPWIMPSSVPRAPDQALQSPGEVPALAPMPPFAAFAASIERPLFTPSRRPPPDTSAAPSSQGPAARYRLVGLMAVGNSRRALLVEGDRRFEIAEGAVLDGWAVTRIEQDRVVLSSRLGSEVMLMLPRPAGREKESSRNNAR